MDSQNLDFFEALTARDAGADGVFVYAVKTTGIYCLPSCAAKNPRPENIAYYATGQAARAAGYRPCKRCRPEEADQNAARIAAACRAIEAAVEAGDTPPDLARLAAAAKLSPSHFHRLFKAATGVTPKGYAAARRAGRAKSALKTAASVTQALYDSGHSAPSRFHATTSATLGMTPREFRAGGGGQTLEFAIAPCALGLVLAARTAKGFCAIFLGDDEAALEKNLAAEFPKATRIRMAGDDLAGIVAAIAAPGRGSQNLPLDIAGTAFQRQVFEVLRAIPPGQTATYTQIAQTIGRPAAVRAVAGACAANRLAVAIPCHRAIRADGGLAGYRWGLARKRKLLEAERDA